MAAERHDAAFIVGAVVGGLAGAAGALWLAPQAGVQTRGQLAEQWQGVSARVSQGVADLETRARALLGRDEGAVPVGQATPAEAGSIGVEATVDGVVVLDAEPAPPGPRPGPIVGGTVVTGVGGPASAGLAEPDGPTTPTSRPSIG